MRRCRQKTDIGRMTAIDIRMRDSRQDGEVSAVILEDLEVARRSVVSPCVSREELSGQQTKIIADAEHTARLCGNLGVRRERSHRVEQRQRQAYADAAKQTSSRNGGSVRSGRFHHSLLSPES